MTTRSGYGVPLHLIEFTGKL